MYPLAWVDCGQSPPNGILTILILCISSHRDQHGVSELWISSHTARQLVPVDFWHSNVKDMSGRRVFTRPKVLRQLCTRTLRVLPPEEISRASRQHLRCHQHEDALFLRGRHHLGYFTLPPTGFILLENPWQSDAEFTTFSSPLAAY
jgi:hypothetical protein